MIHKKTINKTVLILLLFTFSSGIVLSQSDLYEQGYLILSNGDTLFGYVKDPALRESLYLSVTYSDNQAGENSVTYNPFEVNEYYYEPGFCFVSRIDNLREDPGRIFMQCLVEGYASIYSYEFEQKQIFILQKEKIPAVYLEKLSGNDRMDQPSREKLMNFLSDCSDITDKVNNLQFKADDLVKLVKLYNRCLRASRETIVYKLDKERVFRVGVTMGINLSEIKVHAPIDYQDLNLKTGLGFNIGVGFDFYFLNRFTANVKIMWV